MKKIKTNKSLRYAFVVLFVASMIVFSFVTAPKATASHAGTIEIQNGNYHIFIKGTNASVDSEITLTNIGNKALHNVSVVQIFSVIRDEEYPLRGWVITKVSPLKTIEAHESKTITFNKVKNLSGTLTESALYVEHPEPVLYIDIYQGREWDLEHASISEGFAWYAWMIERYTKVGELNNSLVHGYLDTLLSPSLAHTLPTPPTPTLPTPPPEEGVPGFEAIFAIAGILAIVWLLRRRK